MDGVDEGKIREIAETGGEEGETPNDVLIEVITTNSSEGGAKSEFSNLYSRNIEINDVETNNKNSEMNLFILLDKRKENQGEKRKGKSKV